MARKLGGDAGRAASWKWEAAVDKEVYDKKLTESFRRGKSEVAPPIVRCYMRKYLSYGLRN